MKETKGLRGKFIIKKASGKPVSSEAKYFVLRYDNCIHSKRALDTYCKSISKENCMIANDLYNELGLDNEPKLGECYKTKEVCEYGCKGQCKESC